MIERILAALLLAAIGIATVQTYRLQNAQLALAEAQRVHAQQLAADSAYAVKAWRAEWDRQQAADAEQRVQDRQHDTATAAALRDVAARYAGLAERLAPPGTCRLSPEWVKQFNEAR